MCLQMVEKIATEGVANFSVNKNTLPFSERPGFHTCLCLWCVRVKGVSPLFIHKLMEISVSSPGIPGRISTTKFFLPSLLRLVAGGVFEVALSGADIFFLCMWLFLRWKNIAPGNRGMLLV